MLRGYGMESHFRLALGIIIDECVALLVTSSQNFVGRMKGSIRGSELSYWEGAFSLSKRLVEAM